MRTVHMPSWKALSECTAVQLQLQMRPQPLRRKIMEPAQENIEISPIPSVKKPNVHPTLPFSL